MKISAAENQALDLRRRWGQFHVVAALLALVVTDASYAQAAPSLASPAAEAVDRLMAEAADKRMAAMPPTLEAAIAAHDTWAVSYHHGTWGDWEAALQVPPAMAGNREKIRAKAAAAAPGRPLPARFEDRPAPAFVPPPRSMAEVEARLAARADQLEVYKAQMATWRAALAASGQTMSDPQVQAAFVSVYPFIAGAP